MSLPEKNYDLQTLMNLTGQNAEATNNLIGVVRGIATKVEGIETQVKDMSADINYLKNKSEIGYEQRRQIRDAVHTRVYGILDIPFKRSDRTSADKLVVAKYASIFFNRCYSEVPRLGHLGSPYGMTTKENYDYALRDIEAWSPSQGVNSLKREADALREVRRIAAES